MKKKRQDTILALIAAEDIPTQEVLRERMAEQGFAVTQATLSRDIRELKLTKERRSGGRACYIHRCGRKSTAAFCRMLHCGQIMPETFL